MPSVVIEISSTTTEQWPRGQRQESWEGRGHKEGKQGLACPTLQDNLTCANTGCLLVSATPGSYNQQSSLSSGKGLPQPEVA